MKIPWARVVTLALIVGAVNSHAAAPYRADMTWTSAVTPGGVYFFDAGNNTVLWQTNIMLAGTYTNKPPGQATNIYNDVCVEGGSPWGSGYTVVGSNCAPLGANAAV